MAKKQNLVQAVHVTVNHMARELYGAVRCLRGKQAGSPEAEAAIAEIERHLPPLMERSYSVEEYVSALFTIDGSGAFLPRQGRDVMGEAVRITQASWIDRVVGSTSPEQVIAAGRAHGSITSYLRTLTRAAMGPEYDEREVDSIATNLWAWYSQFPGAKPLQKRK